METTAIEISQDVKEAAIKYAANYSTAICRTVARVAFEAGAAFQKPIEHNQLPNPKDNGNLLGE